MAPKVKPMPAPTMQDAKMSCQTSLHQDDVQAVAGGHDQSAGHQGRLRALGLGEEGGHGGAAAIITRPIGASTRPAVSSDLPRP
ncbi:hypothetical protein SALBM311S_11760 [Streptomyces alboniger]